MQAKQHQWRLQPDSTKDRAVSYHYLANSICHRQHLVTSPNPAVRVESLIADVDLEKRTSTNKTSVSGLKVCFQERGENARFCAYARALYGNHSLSRKQLLPHLDGLPRHIQKAKRHAGVEVPDVQHTGAGTLYRPPRLRVGITPSE